MSEAARTMRQKADFHVDGIRGLSRSAVRFLQQHPKEARIAVAAALEAAATQAELEEHAAPSDLPESLKRFVVRRPWMRT